MPIAGIFSLAVLAASILGSQALGDVAALANQNGQPLASDSGRIDDSGSPSWLFKLNKKYSGYEDGAVKIRTGVGGPVAPLTWFFPRSVEVKAGETVTWYNPTSVGEPHTVTFIRDPADYPALDVPYIISNSSALAPLDPTANADPTLMPGPDGKLVAVIANARAYSPVAVTNGNAQYLPLNGTYTMTGNESYVNSALIWPEGQAPPGLPEISSFSVKFQKEGTYDYICILHPWMAGRVTVT